jgi:type VI secretion system secreted protein VgrG
MSPNRRTFLPTRRAGPVLCLAVALLGTTVLAAQTASAATAGPVGLGTAESFAVLAGAGITNTGPTTITGDVGTFPTTTRSGFSSVTLTGTNHGGDAVTQGAKDALVTAYDDAAGRTPATPVAVELGGSTLLAGVYTSGTFGLTGTLTLDAEGREDAMFVFQAASTLITETDSRVVLVNGASPCNVVWQVGSSATFKPRTRFTGDVLAYTSITAQTAATFRGRLLARNGAVTLHTNTIDRSACGTTVLPTASASAAAPSSTPVATASPAGTVPSGGSGTVVTPRAPGAGAPVPRTVAAPPRRTVRGAPTPHLPETGLRTGLLLAALLLLVLGFLTMAASRGVAAVPGRHRRGSGHPGS